MTIPIARRSRPRWLPLYISLTALNLIAVTLHVVTGSGGTALALAVMAATLVMLVHAGEALAHRRRSAARMPSSIR